MTLVEAGGRLMALDFFLLFTLLAERSRSISKKL